MENAILPVVSVPDETVSVRSMFKAELETIFNWSEKEGWNPGKYEADAFYAINPKGYMALTINNSIVASLLSILYSPDFVFMALYIVKPEFRGKGYGKMLWDVVMKTLANCKTIGFSGVLSRVEDYKKSGFRPYFFDSRWCAKSHALQINNVINTDVTIENLVDVPFRQLIDYDSVVFAIQREAFLEQWFSMPESSTLVAVGSTGAICGYGVISVTSEGYKIAPLYAENNVIAEKLLFSLCSKVDSQAKIYMDIPEVNTDAVELVKRIGFKMVFKTMRMYKGERLQTQDEKMFGLTGLELG